MSFTQGLGATAPGAPFSPVTVERRSPGARDVEIEILHCGICHSDLHDARNEWGRTTYPLVPGHEIVGRVTAVGAEVGKFAVGDHAGVGCMVDSCQSCEPCREGQEQFCEEGMTLTYGGTERQTGRKTAGGYSRSIVVDERFVLRISKDADLAATAPLLCAGITTYSPLRYWNVGEGTRVGIVGFGGLGHVGVKIAAALGARVTVFSTSPDKADDAIALGAEEVAVSTDPAQMEERLGKLDFILDTVAVSHDLDQYLRLLRPGGSMVLLGIPEVPHGSPDVRLLLRHRTLSGSLMGGIAETQEMLDFCAEKDITADVERIAVSDVDDAYDRLARGDVRFRFVIDLSTMPGPGEVAAVGAESGGSVPV